MTAKQSTEFDLFGCACRCLIALANAGGANLTKENIIDKFTPKYWVNTNQCGGLTKNQIKGLAIDMGLAGLVEETQDFGEVRAAIQNKTVSGILLYTQKIREANGSLSEYHHCSVVSVTSVQGNDLLYMEPIAALNGFTGHYLTDASIAPFVPTFLLLRP